MIIIWGSRWWVGVYSLIGTVVAASGPVSTAAVPFSNLVVSIVVACTCFYFCISTSGCSLPNDTLGCVAASRTKGRRCLISSLRRWVVLLGRRKMIMNVNKLISWGVGLGWVMWSTASEISEWSLYMLSPIKFQSIFCFTYSKGLLRVQRLLQPKQNVTAMCLGWDNVNTSNDDSKVRAPLVESGENQNYFRIFRSAYLLILLPGV